MALTGPMGQGTQTGICEGLAFFTPLRPPRALGETPLGRQGSQGGLRAVRWAGLCVLKTAGAEAKSSKEQNVLHG